jgi:ABC-type molybdate transport system substrate-binding protein
MNAWRVVKQINNKSIEVKIGKNKLVICQNSATASEIEKLYIDEKGDVYLYMFASKGTENGIAKVSENGSFDGGYKRLENIGIWKRLEKTHVAT